MNTLRNPRYIKLAHSINSCINRMQLETLYGLVSNYTQNFRDGSDMMQIYLEKNATLPPTFEDEFLSIHHKQLSK